MQVSYHIVVLTRIKLEFVKDLIGISSRLLQRINMSIYFDFKYLLTCSISMIIERLQSEKRLKLHVPVFYAKGLLDLLLFKPHCCGLPSFLWPYIFATEVPYRFLLLIIITFDFEGGTFSSSFPGILYTSSFLSKKTCQQYMSHYNDTQALAIFMPGGHQNYPKGHQYEERPICQVSATCKVC